MGILVANSDGQSDLQTTMLKRGMCPQATRYDMLMAH